MTESFIQLPVDSTGKKARTIQLVVGSNTVEHQVMVPADSAGNLLTSIPTPATPNVPVLPVGAVPQAQQLSGSMTIVASTAYQTLTLTSMQGLSTASLNEARQALVLISIGATGVSLPELILRFTDTVGGVAYNLDYTILPAITSGTTPNGPVLAAGSILAVPVSLTQGTLRTCQLIYRFPTTPSAVSMTAQVTLQSAPFPPGTVRLDDGSAVNSNGLPTSSPPVRLTLTTSRIGPWFWTGNIRTLNCFATVPTAVTGTTPTLAFGLQTLLNGVSAVTPFASSAISPPVSGDTYAFVYGQDGLTSPVSPKLAAQPSGVGSVNGVLGEWARVIWTVGGTTPSIPLEYTVFGYTQ